MAGLARQDVLLNHGSDMGSRLQRLVSGGQAGVDRAALDVAIELGLPCGGWCPQGRLAEDGPIARHYPLRETPSENYVQRTRWNVRDSDGTLILACGSLTGGTSLTRLVAKELGRPIHVADPTSRDGLPDVARWLGRYKIDTLNVAGPRASTTEGIYEAARGFLRALLGDPAE